MEVRFAAVSGGPRFPAPPRPRCIFAAGCVWKSQAVRVLGRWLQASGGHRSSYVTLMPTQPLIPRAAGAKGPETCRFLGRRQLA